MGSHCDDVMWLWPTTLHWDPPKQHSKKATFLTWSELVVPVGGTSVPLLLLPPLLRVSSLLHYSSNLFSTCSLINVNVNVFYFKKMIGAPRHSSMQGWAPSAYLEAVPLQLHHHQHHLANNQSLKSPCSSGTPSVSSQDSEHDLLHLQ